MNPIFLIPIVLVMFIPILSVNAEYSEAKISFGSSTYFTKKMIQCQDFGVQCKNAPKEQRIVTVEVTDSDSNKSSKIKDKISVFVWSDSDQKGITVIAYETNIDSGIFEKQFLITEEKSGSDRIHVRVGDTLSAKYVDKTTPNSKPYEIISTAFVGVTPHFFMERILTENLHVADKHGKSISSAKIGDQVQIISNMRALPYNKIPFVYLVEIQDKNGTNVYLSWIDGVTPTKQILKQSFSWTPQEPGMHTITAYVWESVDNPTALAPPVSIDFDVRR